MNDLISRVDAIEAVRNEIQDFEKNYMHGEDEENFGHDIGFVAGLHRAKHIIRELPSAEAKGDLISRQDAVNTIKRYKHRLEGRGQTYGFLLEEFENRIPSAQTDGGLISRTDAIEEFKKAYWDKNIQSAKDDPCVIDAMTDWAIRTIKALPSADAVSREVYEKRTQTDERIIDSYRREFAEVAEVASADRPIGEWKYLHGSVGPYMTMSCPFCGETFNYVAEWKYNYCPSCGTRMKGGDDE